MHLHDVKVFGIGFAKTGTTSLHAALSALGYEVIRAYAHTWPPAEDQAFDAATHEMIAADFEAIDLRWPGSRFICTTRDRVAWVDSMQRQLTYRRLAGVPVNPGLDALLGAVHATSFSNQELLEAYDRHIARVRAHFTNRPGDVLFVDLCATPHWAPLCRFLGQPQPGVPFPRENSGAGRLRYVQESLATLAWRFRDPRRRLVKFMFKRLTRGLRRG